MAANGFESKSTIFTVVLLNILVDALVPIVAVFAHVSVLVGRLKVMWKNLRDQWKRNLSLKMPPEREWYFQRRINFLAETYEGGYVVEYPPLRTK